MAVKIIETYVPKQILALDTAGPIRLPATIPANAGNIDAGQVMGIRTADNKALPVRRAVITVDAANNVKVVTVGAGNVGKFKVGDIVAWRTLTDPTAHNMGAVTAVGATTVTFTADTGGAITANQAYLYVADGTQAAKAIMEYSVLDDSDTRVVSPYVSGVFRESDLIGFDDVALADLGARRTLGGLVIVPA